MSDFGMRISAEGVDVKTGSDLDMIFTSKFSLLKGALKGNGGSIIMAPNTSDQIVVAHNLGYIPFARVVATRPDTFELKECPFSISGTIGGGGTFSLLVVQSFDSTNLYIDITYTTDTLLDAAIDYEYFIFLDKGLV